MAIRPTASVSFRHEDQSTERQFRNLDERVKEIVSRPAWAGEVILDVELPISAEVIIPHSLGQPVAVFVSAARGGIGGGGVIEVRDPSVDRSKYIVLQAIDFKATVTVDLWVL